ncbi:hypothetical protein PCNPT3_03615 [Psychromonas sp. CNPT3]|uniref:YfgM family protein n=1 Tax=Psychromonas sp. CNPT3 TaxID=314282 RepID=UPI00006E42BB|nr:tetratricopeptide repeat protein [Psychromonas sp. CNPT3]AGH80665.1 hypothetical protein PCNPT3_03615 [Psychromonas sp. CNPT3]
MVDIIEGYETEEQQVDAIKGWWKKNGNTFIITALVVLASLWGWRFYHSSAATSQEEVSQEYTDMMIKFTAQGSNKDFTVIEKFISANSGNNYALLASLSLVKEAVLQKDFNLAKTQLKQLQVSDYSESLNPVINLRLARVEAQLKEYDHALETLALISEKSFMAQVEQARGSVYLLQNDLENARLAFKRGIEASQGRIDPLLQLQFNDLTLEQADSVSAPVLDK